MLLGVRYLAHTQTQVSTYGLGSPRAPRALRDPPFPSLLPALIPAIRLRWGRLAFANSVVPVSSGRYDSSSLSTCSTIDGPARPTHCLEWLALVSTGVGRARTAFFRFPLRSTWRLDGDGQKPVPPQIPRPKEERILEAGVSQPRGKALANQGYQSSVASVAWREGVCCPAAVCGDLRRQGYGGSSALLSNHADDSSSATHTVYQGC